MRRTGGFAVDAQGNHTTVWCHERIQTPKLERPGHLGQHVLDESHMHRAHQRRILLHRTEIGAGGEGYGQLVLVELGLEPGVVKVLVEGIQLMCCGGAQLGAAVEIRGDSAQCIAAGHRRAYTPRGGGRAVGLAHRMVHNRGTPSAAAGAWLAAHESFILQHAKVFAGCVQMQIGRLGEFRQEQPR